VGVGVGLATTFTPLTQTSFLPSFLQTYLLVGVSKIAPALLQILPILGAAAMATVTVVAIDPNTRAVAEIRTTNLRMIKALSDR
jgi:hypothetical protein